MFNYHPARFHRPISSDDGFTVGVARFHLVCPPERPKERPDDCSDDHPIGPSNARQNGATGGFNQRSLSIVQAGGNGFGIRAWLAMLCSLLEPVDDVGATVSSKNQSPGSCTILDSVWLYFHPHHVTQHCMYRCMRNNWT